MSWGWVDISQVPQGGGSAVKVTCVTSRAASRPHHRSAWAAVVETLVRTVASTAAVTARRTGLMVFPPWSYVVVGSSAHPRGP